MRLDLQCIIHLASPMEGDITMTMFSVTETHDAQEAPLHPLRSPSTLASGLNLFERGLFSTVQINDSPTQPPSFAF